MSCFTFYSFIPFPPLSPSQVLFSAISKWASCQGVQLPCWLSFADFIPLFSNYNPVVLSFFPWASKENWFYPSSLFNSAVFCLCMLQPGWGHDRAGATCIYTGFSFFYLCPETFVVSPSWCHGWAVVATCRPLVILYACKISISLGGTPNLCTCYRVSPGTKSTFYSFKCSTVILIFSSLLSHYIINGYFAYASWLAVLFTEGLCWSWICHLIKTLIKILFPWVKEHIHIQECEVLSALFGNWKEKRQYWKLQQRFFNLPMKCKNRMTF